MKKVEIIPLEKLEELLKHEIGGMEGCQEILDIFISFFQTFKVKKEVRYEDEDMLLFQYELFDWDGTGGDFELNLTRQLEIPNNDELLQIGVTLYFDPKSIGEIEEFNIWSMDCESIEAWKKVIEATDGFQKILGLKPLKVELNSNET
ncbi:MAG: hypothetical protein R3E32_00395 [Chitinophagales bacterium]